VLCLCATKLLLIRLIWISSGTFNKLGDLYDTTEQIYGVLVYFALAIIVSILYPDRNIHLTIYHVKIMYDKIWGLNFLCRDQKQEGFCSWYTWGACMYGSFWHFLVLLCFFFIWKHYGKNLTEMLSKRSKERFLKGFCSKRKGKSGNNKQCENYPDHCAMCASKYKRRL
jgi:hypothetical protein